MLTRNVLISACGLVAMIFAGVFLLHRSHSARLPFDPSMGMKIEKGKFTDNPNEMAKYIIEGNRLVRNAFTALKALDNYYTTTDAELDKSEIHGGVSERSRYKRMYNKAQRRLHANYEALQDKFDSIIFNRDTKKFLKHLKKLSRAEQFALIVKIESAHSKAYEAFGKYTTFRLHPEAVVKSIEQGFDIFHYDAQ